MWECKRLTVPSWSPSCRSLEANGTGPYIGTVEKSLLERQGSWTWHRLCSSLCLAVRLLRAQTRPAVGEPLGRAHRRLTCRVPRGAASPLWMVSEHHDMDAQFTEEQQIFFVADRGLLVSLLLFLANGLSGFPGSPAASRSLWAALTGHRQAVAGLCGAHARRQEHEWT
jgi:hypothetical protein